MAVLIQINIPRPIVHRAGGMLLQSNKEFAICGDLRPDDVFFYYTTTSAAFCVSPRLLMDLDHTGAG